MAQVQRIGKTAASVFVEDGKTKVVYHSTVVVSWDDTTITLNSGGWRTVTTKARMNQASNQFALEFRVYQGKYMWYVDYNGKRYDFEDGMVLPRGA